MTENAQKIREVYIVLTQIVMWAIERQATVHRIFFRKKQKNATQHEFVAKKQTKVFGKFKIVMVELPC